jgi:hypothetical protein
MTTHSPQNLATFNRNFFDPKNRITAIGSGGLGGKAQGLALIDALLKTQFERSAFQTIEVSLPALTVIRTGVFDAFIERNDLHGIATAEEPDDRIAHAFQKADLPVELLGDLRALVKEVQQPLAVRSSSLLEDALHEPFAGIYETKMTPNNQPDPDVRFRKLTEAIKFVYASTFFKAAKDYRNATGHSAGDEKMAVIIQEVLGHRHGERFYPEISGVARSYNFYPLRPAKPEDGVVSLALGLGKTIVDGGVCWTYSPAHPRATPPLGAITDWLKGTQTDFWAVNMGKPPAFDPIRETEYLINANLNDAEYDGTLRRIASTYDPRSERIVMGTGVAGPRVLTFAPLLVLNDMPLNELIRELLKLCEEKLGAPVEIEFAVAFPPGGSVSDNPARFGFLQVRPMVVSNEVVEIADDEMRGDEVLLASETVLGNGVIDNICDVVYIRPETFDAKHTPRIAAELEMLNRKLVEAGRPYLLIGFGRWGSSDPWLGIPVNWPQVSGAKVMVEATLPNMDKEISQGSHFFHNLASFRVSYFAVRHSGKYQIDWDWLATQTTVDETDLVRHVRIRHPLKIKVDGRSGRGVISKTKSKQ